MIKKHSWKILLGAVIIITAFLFADSSQAKTIITKTADFGYEIKVKVVFDFQDAEAKKQADDLLIKWQEGMTNVWNNKYCTKVYTDNSSDIVYTFELLKMESGKECSDYPDYHCISVVSSEKNKRGNLADVTFSLPNSDKNSTGEWTIQTSERAAAHEAGHMMGLADEYHYEYANGEKKWISDNLKESGEQSIMAQTWGTVTALSFEINKILKNAGLV